MTSKSKYIFRMTAMRCLILYTKHYSTLIKDTYFYQDLLLHSVFKDFTLLRFHLRGLYGRNVVIIGGTELKFTMVGWQKGELSSY